MRGPFPSTVLFSVLLCSVLATQACQSEGGNPDAGVHDVDAGLQCPGTAVPCGDAGARECQDLAASSIHCGQCAQECADGEVCIAGTCAEATCSSLGRQICRDACVDTRSNPLHCGICGNTCEEGFRCDDGNCRSACSPSRLDCHGHCVDSQNDPVHCGGCDTVCTQKEFCTHGTCRPKTT